MSLVTSEQLSETRREDMVEKQVPRVLMNNPEGIKMPPQCYVKFDCFKLVCQGAGTK